MPNAVDLMPRCITRPCCVRSRSNVGTVQLPFVRLAVAGHWQLMSENDAHIHAIRTPLLRCFLPYCHEQK